MEHFLILFIVSLICAAGGSGLMACLISTLPKKANRIIAIVSAVLFVVGLTGVISINKSVDRADVTNTENAIYDISKLTTSTVFFETDGEIKSWSLNDATYISVKEATDEYSNVVVQTTNDKDVDWLIDFKTQSTKYVVYLDANTYAKYKNPTVLYEKGE